jgi:hypothetical protein
MTFHSETFLEAIRAACVSAWAVNRVEYGDPLFIQTGPLPYAVVQPSPPAYEGGTPTTADYRYRFRIVGRFAMPADSAKHAELQKNDRAGEFASALISGSTFATVGYLPQVDAVDPNESDNPHDDTYMVALDFTVSATSNR